MDEAVDLAREAASVDLGHLRIGVRGQFTTINSLSGADHVSHAILLRALADVSVLFRRVGGRWAWVVLFLLGAATVVVGAVIGGGGAGHGAINLAVPLGAAGMVAAVAGLARVISTRPQLLLTIRGHGGVTLWRIRVQSTPKAAAEACRILATALSACGGSS
jgi:hypothetical protein